MALSTLSTAEAKQVTTSRIPALDGIRGFAILVVVIHNASWVLDSSELFPLKLLGSVVTSGWIGVQLFFVLSGFLITGILLQTRDRAGYFRNFYVRRVLRIFPLYYAFLALTLWVFPLVADPSWISAAKENQLWFWTYMSNWGDPFGHSIPGLAHFWSLAVEEQFYLFWPLLVFALSRSSLKAVCVGTVITGPPLRLLLHFLGLPALADYMFTIARWDALAGGALLALLLSEDSGRAWLEARISSVGVAAMAALGLLVLTVRGFNEGELSVQVIGQTITLLWFGWLVGIAVAPTTQIERKLRDALTAPRLRFLGKYSYAIYVVHFPVHIIASRYLRGSVNGPDDLWRLLRWGIYVGGIGTVSVLLALASWHLLEKRFLDLKDRWAARPVPQD